MHPEIYAYIEEWRASMHARGTFNADSMADAMAENLPEMHRAGNEDPDIVEWFDALLEIVRRKVPFQEKENAVTQHLADAPPLRNPPSD